MGRTKLGNVLFAKRVSPAMAARLKEVAEGLPLPQEAIQPQIGNDALVKENRRLVGENKALYDNVGELEAKVKDLEVRRENWMRADENTKVRYAFGLLDKFKAQVKAKYPDEGW